MERYFQVVTTFPNRAQAGRLARLLVESGLAGCVQVLGPIQSTYRWQGRVETSREWLCLAKTDRGRLRGLIRAVEENHPYDTPEVIAVPITAGSRRYLDWLRATAPRRRE